ncbi:MAG: hypothetical protein RL653_612 [Pseudomonadota bacterium]|jgi:hypothetical protein
MKVGELVFGEARLRWGDPEDGRGRRLPAQRDVRWEPLVAVVNTALDGMWPGFAEAVRAGAEPPTVAGLVCVRPMPPAELSHIPVEVWQPSLEKMREAWLDLTHLPHEEDGYVLATTAPRLAELWVPRRVLVQVLDGLGA